MNIDKRFYDLASHLWRGGKYSYFWTPDDGNGEKVSYWLTANGDIEVPKMFDGKDTYFGINPTTIRRSEHERASIADIAAINCLYCEFDCETDEDRRKARKVIDSWPIKPAAVIDSGGGYHVYVLLRDTKHLDTLEKINDAIGLQWAFAQWAGGDTSVNDLARVLRVPGTTNYKERYAPNFPLVSIVEWDMTQQYDIADLEALLQPIIDKRDAAKAHTPPPSTSTVSLSDQELLNALFRSRNGSQYEALWRGDMSSAGNDHSKADQILCNGLAWVTGRDTARMDSMFRQSGLYRDKWETNSYRERTLNNAASTAQTVYTPGHVDQDAVNAANSAIGLGSQSSNGNGAGMGAYKPPSNPDTADYIKALNHLGYHFRLNDLDDRIEVNSQRLDDVRIAEIKNRMRDLGFKRSQIIDMQDAYIEEAGKNRYHPIRDYLQSLQWDGDDHIRLLARHFEDKHAPLVYEDGSSETVFYVWLKRWLIAAAAKAFHNDDVSAQNAVLVLEGGQNLGKSTFARWLCSGMPRYFIEKSIEPDSKEDERRLASKWIWEIGELGATTRKADREALKSFLTRVEVTFRNPYAREDSEKYALASFIGTVNNEGGFLQDATGTRRFMTVGLSKIHHSYVDDMDINQVWAQAYQLYAGDESWRLTPAEAQLRDDLNSDYKVEDAYEGWISRYFDIDLDRAEQKTAGWFTTTQEIVGELKRQGVTGDTRAITMFLASTMKGLGLEKTRHPKPSGARGYWGVKIKP